MLRSARFFPVAMLCALAGCGERAAPLHYPSVEGWSLCRAELPIDMTAFPAPNRATADQRTDIAAAIALAFALRCIESPESAPRAGAFDRIVALPRPNVNQVVIYPAAGSALAVEIPAYADYRTDAFDADVRNAIACFLTPGAIPDRDACLPD